MTGMPLPPTILAPLAAASALALSACAGEEGSAEARTAMADLDPALTSALEDPILTDPALSQQANANAVRPPGGPLQAQYPPGTDPDDLADAPAPDECGAAMVPGPQWAGRLPAGIAPYPGARLAEAAGTDAEGCRLRMLVLHSPDAAGKIVEWYGREASRAGFSADAEHRGPNQLLSGTHPRTGDGYYLIAASGPEASEIHLLVRERG